MMDIRVQGYENQVKLFLVLLVLFLVASGVVGLNVLYRSRELLIEEASTRITSATRALQREVIETGLDRAAAGGGAAAGVQTGAGARLRDLARAYSIASAEIVDPAGRVLASTEAWRPGVIDPESAAVAAADAGQLEGGGAIIREPVGSATAAAGDEESEYGPDRGEVLVFVSLGRGGGGPAPLLRTGHEVIGVRTVARQIRFLAWAQAIAGAVALALVLLFVRWVLKPYRALRETAMQIEARGGSAALDDPEGLIASFRGVIGKLKDQERELERMHALASPGGSAALSQEMLDGLTSGVLIVGPDGLVRQLNPAGETILGSSRDQVVGRAFREVFAASPDLLGILSDAVESGRPRSREVVPYLAAGARAGSRVAHLGVTVSPLPGPPSARGGAFCLFSDLTEIRGLQDRVRLRENLAGLGSMSAGIAHEFRNSLATILGYARLIAREKESDHAAAIAREVESIGRVVDEFLRYARPAAIQASDWSPRPVLEEVARETARDLGRPGVAIAFAGDWPETIRADEGLLRQAFANLLRNAVEAIPSETGMVTVSAAIEDHGRQLRIEVSDSGSGIPPEVLSRLFTPFVTTKPAGTGLGLALAQKAIVCHDGAITARNMEAGGACFAVTLPTQVGALPD